MTSLVLSSSTRPDFPLVLTLLFYSMVSFHLQIFTQLAVFPGFVVLVKLQILNKSTENIGIYYGVQYNFTFIFY